MELTGIGPSGKLGDTVEFSKELTNRPAGILALAEKFDLCHQAGQRILRLADGHVRVVLALALEAGVVLVQFLPEEVGQTLTGGIPERKLVTWRNTVR